MQRSTNPTAATSSYRGLHDYVCVNYFYTLKPIQKLKSSLKRVKNQIYIYKAVFLHFLAIFSCFRYTYLIRVGFRHAFGGNGITSESEGEEGVVELRSKIDVGKNMMLPEIMIQPWAALPTADSRGTQPPPLRPKKYSTSHRTENNIKQTKTNQNKPMKHNTMPLFSDLRICFL